MIAVQDLKNGTTFELENELYVVIKYEHIKVGRGSATIRVKIKNLKTGGVLEKTFINSARVEPVSLIKKKMQFLYNSGNIFVFMDPDTYDQVEIPADILGSASSFLKEGMIVPVLYWEEKPLWVELQPKMELTVTDTDPGVKGNSATNVYKPATLENGYQLRVPLFINKGDKIRVDTRTGEYVERAK
jgi:elongation factor P